MNQEHDPPDRGMRDEYDFRTAIRGKYAQQYAAGTNLVFLDPDVAAVFSDSKSVNEALRALIHIARQSAPRT